jgi:hypothetical protein
MNAASLLAQLRNACISITSEGNRLIVEGAPGVVTPKLREQLVTHKAALITALESEHFDCDADPETAAATHEIAVLLATAYRRHAAVLRVGTDQAKYSGKEQLANSPARSVHGVAE